jgi:hypothetical protein
VFFLQPQTKVNAITAIDFNVHYDVIFGTLSIFFNENKNYFIKLLQFWGKLAIMESKQLKWIYLMGL